MVDRSENRRLSRVSTAIREMLADILVKDVNNPLLAWVTVSGVEVSADLRHARVFYTASGAQDSEAIASSLEKAASYMQREIGSRLRLRNTPRLSFRRDESFEEGERIDKLLCEVKDEDAKRRKDETEEKALDRLISEADSILVVTHRNPDGDAIGSLLGLSGILGLLGKTTTAYCPDGIPKVLSFLEGATQITRKLDEDESFDLTILLDTADEALAPEGLPSAPRRGTLFVIDHHLKHGDLGDIVIRREASAVGEILFELARELVWPMDQGIAMCLYTSIVADTGSFRYSSTTPSTHRAAAELLAAGARPWPVATSLYESFPLKRQRLLAEVLSTLKINEDGRFAQLYSTPDMLAKVGADKEDLDGMINFGRSVSGVEIAAMFRVQAGGDIKVSFRSKGRINVAELAARFDGGGHRNASGCTLHDVDLDEARRIISEAADTYLAELGPSKLKKPVS
ncbi:MAG: 30S ribosome-binding factor RbfA [Deltaproteobacteria bacterium]|nr:30S ribosome-binding factor RbfA [Deltaproteobacteria bacterium]